jgi:hypothetical protein
MPDAYQIYDSRFISAKRGDSAVNGLFVQVGGPPVGKVWTIIAASYFPSAAETRTVFWSLISAGNIQYALTVPQAIALSTAVLYPFVIMGLEFKLFPGQSIQVNRDVATAGSTCTINIIYYETDLPPFEYEDPQNIVRAQRLKHGWNLRSISRGGGTPAGSVPPEAPSGGRRGGREI